LLSNSDCHRGYVLLLVMLVLAIAAAAMAGVCRMSLEKAVQAGRAESDLQRQWAVITCRAVLLPKAEALLNHGGNSVNEIRRSIQLSGKSYTLVFGDEQAKANVNLLYAKSGLSGAEREVRAIVGSSGAPVPVELRPIPGIGLSFGTPDAPDDQQLPAFETFQQMLGPVAPDILIATRGNNPSLASQLTCWGDGALNFRRASPEATRAVLSADLAKGDISRLLDARAKDPQADLADLVDTLELSPAKLERVETLLSDQSACHSLWIISDSNERTRYDLSIAEGSMVMLFDW
jgi:type II secretory pathway component PulK